VFVQFFYTLRDRGVPVTPTSFLRLQRALSLGLVTSLDDFYTVARSLLVKSERYFDLYDQVFRELLSFMAEDPKTITRATRLIWVGHNLERSADRVTNIAERIIYVVTGSRDSMIASKY